MMIISIKAIIELGRSNYHDKVLVRTACTPDTIDNLYDAYKFALDNVATSGSIILIGL